MWNSSSPDDSSRYAMNLSLSGSHILNYTIKTQFEYKYHFNLITNKYTVQIVIHFDFLVQFSINKVMMIT